MSRNTAPRYSARNPARGRPPELPPSMFSLMFPPDYREWFPRQGGNRCHACASSAGNVIASEAIHSDKAKKEWIASRSLSSGARSRDPLARNDGGEVLTLRSGHLAASRRVAAS